MPELFLCALNLIQTLLLKKKKIKIKKEKINGKFKILIAWEFTAGVLSN